MPIYWVVFLLAGICLAIMTSIVDQSSRASTSAEISALAQNFLVYRTSIANYAEANPSESGSVADSLLVLPVWYRHFKGVEGVVINGTSFTYYASPPNGLISELALLTESSASIGYAAEGRLAAPDGALSSITLPAVIPSGSAVAYR